MTIQTIAVDGPTASGKGTFSRKLAEHLGFAHLDTGLLYRAVGWQVKVLGKSFDVPDYAIEVAQHFDSVWLSNAALRTDQAADAASRVAIIPQVRDALLAYQRNFAESPPYGLKGAVLDGRDIGTVILPHADLKFFVTASVDVRAKRRFKELKIKDETIEFQTVLESLIERDKRDSTRSSAPLLQAEDAYLLDNSAMTADEAVAYALNIIHQMKERFAKERPKMVYL
jgi:CMP/dCMP kinase